MKQIITKSDNYKSEYCCTVVQIGEIKPIEGKDLIGQTLVNGLSIVVRKDQVKEGDILIYAANETELNHDFLSVNNLFEDKEMNMDKEKRGYFNKYGRVRMIKLGGCSSMGYLFGFNELQEWCPSLQESDLPEIGEDFDTVNGELFIKAYVPRIKEGTSRLSKDQKRNKKLARYDRIIPGEFNFHYDTKLLAKEVQSFKPDDSIVIDVKIHGTSFILANILTNKPKWNGLYSKIFPYLPKWLQFTIQEYDVIYSSRNVIKNQYFHSEPQKHFYGTDVWQDYYLLLKDKIPTNMTIYGEIVGYVTGSNTMIQKGYDYGCKPGENKLMIYRINDNCAGTHFEYNVREVYEWTLKLIKEYPELKDRIHPINILYEGTLKDLYPEIDTANHWHENVLEALKNDKEHFGMELNEPLCRLSTPREGICIRKNNDPINECWKLKCQKFLFREAKLIDSGEVDIEMSQTDY